MDFNIDVRRIQLESLEQFIASSKRKVQNVLETLNWESSRVLKDNKFITCSLDTNHKVPQKSADSHIERCALRKEGYELHEPFLSEPLHDGRSSITIDDHKKIEILSEAHKSHDNFRSRWNGQDPDPKTTDRLMTTYSSNERLALYNYAVSSTKGPDKMPEYNVHQPKRDESKPLSYEEQLALERDAKRRRVKYKSVHTSCKSHTEVLREVIASQMEVYREWAGGRTGRVDDEHDARSTSRNSSNSSRGTLRRSARRECSDTESASRRGSYERCGREKSSRERDKDRGRSEERRRGWHGEDRRERGEDRRRAYDCGDGKRRHERSKRSRSREVRRSRDRRNGYKDYRS